MRRALLMLTILLPVAVAIGLTPLLQAGEDDVLQAMRAELTRSQQRLRLPDYVEPYYLAYRLDDERGAYGVCTLGATQREGELRNRRLYAEVRVGDYDFDNTSMRNEMDTFDPDIDTADYLHFIDAPLDDDVDALRARLWRLTDLRFKNAVAAYLSKKARGVYRETPDVDLADFTREEPVKFVQPPLNVEIDKDKWLTIARRASLLQKRFPQLLTMDVSFQASIRTKYLLSTEGTELVTREYLFAFFAQAEALTDDGMTVSHAYARYARSAAGMPDEAEVLAGVEQMAKELVALRNAPELGPYAGPAILDPSVAGTFFHEAIGHRLEGDRTRSHDEGQTFKNKIGELILPPFLNVYDDPTVARAAGVDLNGYYRYDDQGVPAQRADLVRAGRMIGWLLSRRPVEGFAHSNGHGRASPSREPMSRMGNLFITVDETVSLKKLKKMLLAQARRQDKPYGLWLRRGLGGETATDRYNFQAFASRPVLLYRVDAQTGAEELVRGVELVGTPLTSVNKVIAAGDDVGAFNGYCGAESGFIPVSSVAPSLLVSEIELQRVRDKPTKPPILPAPYLN